VLHSQDQRNGCVRKRLVAVRYPFEGQSTRAQADIKAIEARLQKARGRPGRSTLWCSCRVPAQEAFWPNDSTMIGQECIRRTGRNLSRLKGHRRRHPRTGDGGGIELKTRCARRRAAMKDLRRVIDEVLEKASR